VVRQPNGWTEVTLPFAHNGDQGRVGPKRTLAAGKSRSVRLHSAHLYKAGGYRLILSGQER
jgi:hypothetical protein